MDTVNPASAVLAAKITKAASKQTYYTIRFFVDRDLVEDAYRAYGYFRWVDDTLDAPVGTKLGKVAFIKRQCELLDACYRDEVFPHLCPEEQILVDLVRNNSGQHTGLKSYLDNMMAVMAFDVKRRNRLISGAEISEYTRLLSTAVTDAMHYFIGHDDPVPNHPARYHAVVAAHITHMLRDACEDSETGYFNVPREYLAAYGITVRDVESEAYRKWVCRSVKEARELFETGRGYLAQVSSLRCRLAGYAYAARFEWMLRVIERENYCLRLAYPERKSLWASLWISLSTLTSLLAVCPAELRSSYNQ